MPSPAPLTPQTTPRADAPARDLRALVAAAVIATADAVRAVDPDAAEALLRAVSGAHGGA